MDIGSPEWSHLLIDGAAAFGLALQPDHTRLFARHALELLKWNAVTNLTAITRPEDIARQHFLDSLAPVGLIAPGSELLDVGSGGGFPGLPLHAVIDGLRTTLIDASRKKVSFLRHTLRALELRRIAALQIRVEEIGANTAAPNSYDLITSRAVSALAPLVRAACPLLRPRGRLIAWRGGISAGEMNGLREVAAAGDLGGDITLEPVAYSLPGLKHQRTLLIVSRGNPVAPQAGQGLKTDQLGRSAGT
jgi:16S rRNA (guanine527-N7)-methyltransferase